MMNMLMNMLISKKDWLDRDKNSSFECGFDPLNSSRLPFSIHFYLIGILFLMILYLGLEFEKLEGSLKWIF